MSPTAVVRVAAAVVLGSLGEVLLAQRPPGKAYAGYWEFPGGKLEPGETAHDALVRELREELGIEVRAAAPWLTQCHNYPHANVRLEFFRVFDWAGEPFGHDGQAFAWQTPGRFDVEPLLPANTAVLRALELPALCTIVPVTALGRPEGLAGVRRALDQGTGLIHVADGYDRAVDRAQVDALLALAAPFGARVLLDGAPDRARVWGAAGVLWGTRELAAAAARPDGVLVAASCRSAAELARAGALGLDWALLGPVRAATATRAPAASGWGEFVAAIAGTTLPVYATGTLAPADLPAALRHGAQGIALPIGAE